MRRQGTNHQKEKKKNTDSLVQVLSLLIIFLLFLLGSTRSHGRRDKTVIA